MVEKRITETKTFCDRCGNEETSLTYDCRVCGREVCMNCHCAAVLGCMVRVVLCVDCADMSFVAEVVEKAGKEIEPIVRRREVSLAALRRKAKAAITKARAAGTTVHKRL